MNKRLSTVAVDLTPILPGGENGGAKIFVLELLRHLVSMKPDTRFLLLTHGASHEELASLDRPNVRRLMVTGSTQASSDPSLLQNLASLLQSYLPSKLGSVFDKLALKLNAVSKRGRPRQLLRDQGVALLYCPFTAPTFFELGIPTVCTIYDLQHKTYPQFFDAGEVAHRDHLFASACSRASALTAISDYSRDSVLAHSTLDPERIRTIHLRMAQRIAPSEKLNTGVLERLGLTSDRYLVYPANFWKHKNHEILLTAFGMACIDGLAPDIKLVCTGAPGERQKWLASAAKEMNLGNRILFPGYLPTTELGALMTGSRGMVFPSLYEGFGLPVIEAMAAGVPVACSNTTSLPEVACDASILFDPRVPTQIAQAIVSLVKNDALRPQLIQKGRLRAAEFSDSKRMAEEYWQLFQYALENVRHENILTGVSADGWAGHCLELQVSPSSSAQCLEIEFMSPDWLPNSVVTVQACQKGKERGAALAIQRGTNATFALPLHGAGGCYQVRIAPTFVPAQALGGDDHRELSVAVKKCGIKRNNNEYVELFPREV